VEQTLFAILTDEKARSSEVIELNLDREIVAGAPWFTKEIPEATDLQQAK
jgi:hypothetical protein